MSEEDYSIFEERKAERQLEKSCRRASASQQFASARNLAAAHHLILHCCSDVHYQLTPTHRRWLINVYPGNQRLYSDRSKPGPYLKSHLPDQWDLLDVVKAAVAVLDK